MQMIRSRTLRARRTERNNGVTRRRSALVTAVTSAAVVAAAAGTAAATATGPSGVAYEVVTICSTGAMTVRADATRIGGNADIPFTVTSSLGVENASVSPGQRSSRTVRGDAARTGGVTVAEAGVTVATGSYLTSCGPPTPDPVQSKFNPMTPTRVLDTRPATAVGYSGPKPAGGSTVVVDLAGRNGIAADAVAVVVNVTATEPEGPGFVQAFPNGRGQPGASSNVNIEFAGQTIPNAAIVWLGDDGAMALFTSVSSHLVVDIAGYFVPGTFVTIGGSSGYLATDGRFGGVEPTRVFDTRASSAVQYSGPKPAAGALLDVAVSDSVANPLLPNVPNALNAEWVGSVVLNVTATESSGPGFVQVAAGGSLTPGASSSLNLTAAGETIANLVIVPVSADGRVSIFTSGGSHLVIDVLGYFTNANAPTSISGLFVPLDPERVLDSRAGSRIDGGAFRGAAGSGATVHFDALHPTMGSVVLNVVSVGSRSPGFVQVGPNFQPDGLTFGAHSNINMQRSGQPIANLAISQAQQLNVDGVTINTSAAGELVADVFGWFTFSIVG